MTIPVPSKERMRPDVEFYGSAASPQVRFDPPNKHAFSVFYCYSGGQPGSTSVGRLPGSWTQPQRDALLKLGMDTAEKWIADAEPVEFDIMVAETKATKVTVLAHCWAEAEEIAGIAVETGEIPDHYFERVAIKSMHGSAMPSGMDRGQWRAILDGPALSLTPAQMNAMNR